MASKKNSATPAQPEQQLAFTGIGALYVNGVDGATVDAFGRVTLHTKNMSLVLAKPVVDHLIQSVIKWTEERNSQ